MFRRYGTPFGSIVVVVGLIIFSGNSVYSSGWLPIVLVEQCHCYVEIAWHDWNPQ